MTVDFDKLRDVHIPAAILKSFMRQLPEPLLPYDLYDHIIRVQCKMLKSTRFLKDQFNLNVVAFMLFYVVLFK